MQIIQRRRTNIDPLLLFCDFGTPSSYSGNGTSIANLGTASVSGTLTGSPVYSAAFGGNLQLNGVTDYVQFNDTGAQLVPTVGLTVIAWARLATADRWLLDKAGGSRTGTGYAFAGNGPAGQIDFQINGKVISSLNGQFNNTWTMLSGTWVPSTSMTFRRNDTVLAQTTTTVPSSLGTVNTSMRWGARTPGDFTNGAISIIKVIQKALTATELADEYELYRGRYGLPAL
jgi:hypothetical protein